MKLTILFLAALVTGCQTTKTAPVATSSSNDSYFPLATGATWTRWTDDGGVITARVMGTRTVGRASCTVVETATRRENQERVVRVCYEVTSEAVRALETESDGRRTVLTPPRVVLLLPPRPGRSWSWGPPDERARAPISEEWLGEETVQVPAGTFKAWKVKTVTRRGDLTATLFTWYARGVGIVKIDRAEQRGEFELEGVSELVRYRVP